MMFYTACLLRQQRLERERRAYLDGLQQQCSRLIAKAKRRGNVEVVRLLESISAMLRREAVR